MRIARQEAIDTAWALASPATYELMVCQGDYTIRRFQDWLTATLQIAILRSQPAESPMGEMTQRSSDGRQINGRANCLR